MMQKHVLVASEVSATGWRGEERALPASAVAYIGSLPHCHLGTRRRNDSGSEQLQARFFRGRAAAVVIPKFHHAHHPSTKFRAFFSAYPGH